MNKYLKKNNDIIGYFDVGSKSFSINDISR